MRWSVQFRCFVLLAVVTALSSFVLADRLTLNDGTVLEGRVIKQGDGYWIKTDDGETRTVPSADVRKFDKGSGKPAGDAAPSGAENPVGGGGTHAASSSVAQVKRKADAVDLPLTAVTLWQQYIESKPTGDDLKTAKAEQAKWQKMNDDGAERIKGKWVQGQELKDLRKRVEQLSKEYGEALRDNQTLAAIKKLEEAQAIYPNDYHINFWLGFVNMMQHQEDKAAPYFEQALRLHPKLSPALGNLGLILIRKKKIPEAVLKLEESAEAGDSPEIARDLVTALAELPELQHKSERMKGAVAAANLLASKYPDATKTKSYLLIPLRESASHAGPKLAGGMWSGTGFLIADDGLILTNRHVVEGAKTIMVVLDGGVQKAGEIVKIDDEQDLALVRIKTDGTPLPFVQFARNEVPGAGADCTVMGYPLYGRLGTNIKVTRGIVTGIQEGELGPNVLVDAKVNPGNSGGPILDKHGNVMAIVSMKTLSTTSEDTYGIGLSAGHVRKFLEKNKITTTPGPETGAALSAEEIATKVKPAAVCILSTR